MHQMHPLLPRLVADGRTRVLYIHRDVRDVAVSFKRAFGMRGEALTTRIDRDLNAYGSLAKLRQEAPEKFLWQRYDALMSDAASALDEIMDFLGIRVDQDTVTEILDACSTEATKVLCDALTDLLKHRVAAVREQHPQLAARYVKEIGRGSQHGTLMFQLDNPLIMYNHISRDQGASGVWRSALTAEEAELLTERYGAWLADEAYEV